MPIPALQPLPEEAARLERTARILRTGGPGEQIIWRSWGEGPPLVLFHGGHGSWLHWLRNIPGLSRNHRLIVADLPGFGDSDPLAESTREALCDRLAQGLDELDLPPKYHLGGFSFGCIPACFLLPKIARRLHRLFLVGSGGFGAFHPVTDLRRWQDVPHGTARDEINRHNLSILMIHDPARIDETAIRIQGINTERTVQNMRPIAMGSDQRGPLSTYPVPLTVIWGEEDALSRRLFDMRIDYLRSRTPPADIDLLPGVGHWVQYEAPDAVNALVLAAMARDLDLPS